MTDRMTGQSSQVGRRLRERRLLCGLTREQLAVRSGLSAATVWRAEVGKYSPRRSTLMLLCAELGLRVDQLAAPDAEAPELAERV